MKVGLFQVMKELQRLVCYSDFWFEHPGIITGGELEKILDILFKLAHRFMDDA